MTRVTIQYWAAARDAAGVAVESVEATTLAEATALVKRGIAGKEPLLVDVQIDPSFKPV